MKRIMLLIIGLLILLGALVYFTYSVDTYTQDEPKAAPITTGTIVTGSPVLAPTVAIPSAPTSPGLPNVEPVAPQTPAIVAPPVEIPVPNKPTMPDPANPQAETAKAPQTVAGSLGVAPAPKTSVVATQTQSTTPPSEAPLTETTLTVKSSEPSDVPSCVVLCQKVCSTLKDDAQKIVGE